MQTPTVTHRRVRLLGAIRIDGAHVEAGSELDVSTAEAVNLVHRGKAEIVDASAADEPAAPVASAEPQSEQENDHAGQ